MAYLSDASRSFIYKLLRKKRIKLNGKRAEGSELLQPGDMIEFHISQETLNTSRRESSPAGVAATLLNISIVYEDQDLLILNKPAGQPSHGGMKSKAPHLLSSVLDYLRQTGAYPPNATFTPALCNRLDVNTSGLIICGKTYQALRAANALFATPGAILKQYLAIVEGELTGTATLKAHYRKNTATNTAHITQDPTAAQAITQYTSIATSGGNSLVSVNPITGRSHQIRAHMASIGHPLLGDKKYGGKKTHSRRGHLLHCNKLTLAVPLLDYPPGTTWEAEPPAGFVDTGKGLARP